MTRAAALVRTCFLAAAATVESFSPLHVRPATTKTTTAQTPNFQSQQQRPFAINLGFEMTKYGNDNEDEWPSISQDEQSPDFTYEEQYIIEDIHARAAESDMATVLQQTTLPAPLVIKLRQSLNHFKEDIRIVAQTLSDVLDQQLQRAKQTLETLLEAGEIRKLDSLIGQAARNGHLDVAFFNVLSLNMKDAAADVDDDGDQTTTNGGAASRRLQILQHVYTRCQEEVEKNIPPGLALLNRLLRQPVDSIRLNLYQHYLTPQTTQKIVTPDGKEIEIKRQQQTQENDNNNMPPQSSSSSSSSSLVSLDEFIDAIATTVEQIRTVENAGATDRESAAIMVESCRQIAKEALIVLGNVHGVDSPQVIAFQKGLQPVFRPTSPDSPYIKGQT